MTVDYQKCIEMGIPVTIPFPKETVEKLQAAGVEFHVGEELWGRFSTRTPQMGWDPATETWAGIPILVNPKMPPRALMVVRNEKPTGDFVDVCAEVMRIEVNATIIAYIEDLDDGDAVADVIKEREEKS